MTEPEPEPEPKPEPVGRRERPSALARWWPAAAVVFGVVVVAILGLQAPGCPGTSGSEAGAPCPTPATSSPIVGVVVAVDSAGLTNVKGFTLRDEAGLSYLFTMGPLENATEFSPSHLAEHMASSEPIRVFFRTQENELLVYRLEDASTDEAPTETATT